LISVAAFASAVTAIDSRATTSTAVYAVAVATLLALAFVSLFTGFRIAFLPFRLCPIIFTVSAVLVAIGAWV
jgi:hypothetical protein